MKFLLLQFQVIENKDENKFIQFSNYVSLLYLVSLLYYVVANF